MSLSQKENKTMPVSVSDFCSQVTAAKPSSGATFYTQVNQDGSVAVYRSASKSAVATLLYPSVRYLQFADTVSIGDGSGITTQAAAAFIAGLN
jgi:hypothetical protein